MSTIILVQRWAAGPILVEYVMYTGAINRRMYIPVAHISHTIPVYRMIEGQPPLPYHTHLLLITSLRWFLNIQHGFG